MKEFSKSSRFSFAPKLLKVTIFGLCATFQLQAFADTKCFKKSDSSYQVKELSNGRVFDLTPVTLEDAHNLFTGVVQKNNPNYFHYNLETGCMERADNVSSWLFDKNLSSVRVNLQTENGGFVGVTGASFINGGADNGNLFSFESLYEDKLYTWGHHAAVAICVVKSKEESEGSLYILDPSTLLEPSTLET